MKQLIALRSEGRYNDSIVGFQLYEWNGGRKWVKILFLAVCRNRQVQFWSKLAQPSNFTLKISLYGC
jgi:hypothetical protein